jgi:PAS domain S-box-containing protein
MNKVKTSLPFIALLVLPLLLYHFIDISGWMSSSDLHATLEFASSFLAITAGIMVLLHFIISGRRFFLIISVGFVLIGTEEFFHSIFALTRIWTQISPGIEEAISTTWLTGDFILLTSFFIAILFGSKEIDSAKRRPYAVIFNSAGFLLSGIVTLLIFNSSLLHDFVLIGSLSKKITELTFAVLFFILLVFYLRYYLSQKSASPLLWSLTACIIFRFLAHIYIFDARSFYDSNWDAAHLIVFLSYFFPLFGIWGETIKLHKFSQEQVMALDKEVDKHGQAAEALMASEAKLEHIFSNIRDVIYSVDIETKEFKYLSPSFERITGYSSEDIKKMGGREKFIKGVVDKEEFSEWNNFLLNLDEEHSLADFNYETKWLCKDGTYKYLNDHWIPIYVNGKLESTHGILTDITERRLSEQSLTKQYSTLSKLNRFALELSNLSFEDKLESIIAERVKEITGAEVTTFSEYDPSTRTLTMKRVEMDVTLYKKVSKLLASKEDYTQSILSEEQYLEITSKTVRSFQNLRQMSFGFLTQSEGQEIQDFLNADRFLTLAYTIEGTLFGTSLLVMSKTQPDPPNEILDNLIHLVAESLQRKRIETALRESEEKFRTFFEKATDGIYLMDTNRKLILVNDSFASMHGYSLSEMLNITIDSLDAPETIKFSSERIESVIRGDSLRFEATHFHKQGNIITLEVIASLIMLKGEKYIIAFHRDITDRVKASEELKRRMNELTSLNTELEQFTYANQELKQFAYTASHQLQEPIRTVGNYTQIIEEDYAGLFDLNGLRHLHIIRDATARMAVLINSLMEFSQLGRNKKLVAVDCHKLIETVIADLKSLLLSSNTIVDVGDMPVINLYEIEIRQLFQNLISNAVKFQKKDTRPLIRIRSERLSDRWKFSVSDNGLGIAAEHFVKIFDIFQRLHTDEEEFEGKGIGLAYCKKIVQLHLGEIWVESALGEGSTFYFTIPDLKT